MDADVIETLHNEGGDRCVKIVRQGDGHFGFREFRKDPEDAGGWTLVSDAQGIYATRGQAEAAAATRVAWLRDKRLRAKA